MLLYLEVDASFTIATFSPLYFEISYLTWFLFDIMQRSKQFYLYNVQECSLLNELYGVFSDHDVIPSGRVTIVNLASSRDSFPFMAVVAKRKSLLADPTGRGAVINNDPRLTDTL